MAKELDKVDVVIVGSGWAGGITAAELSKEDYNIVMLERGKSQKRTDFVGSKDELKYSRRKKMFQDLSKESLTIRNTLDETATPHRSNEMNSINGTDTGGSGMHWNGMVYRWLPTDFEIRSKLEEKYGNEIFPEYSSAQDWGITYDELDEYYNKFEETTGISGEPDPLRPERTMDYPTPPLKDTEITRLFKSTTKEMGYHPYQIPSANLSETYKNLDGEQINQCMYCAFCEQYGCDFGAKADPLVTVLATAQKSDNFTLKNDSYVTRVLHKNGKATGVKYVDMLSGEEYEQPADLVVVAGYTFTNTRLMLLSDIGEKYDPETGEGVIGKNITAHTVNLTHTRVRGFFDDKKFNRYAGAGALGATMDDFNLEQLDFNEVDFLHGFLIRATQLGDRPISNNFVPDDLELSDWGPEFKDKSLFYTNRRIDMQQQNGVLPQKENYMDLDPNYTDVFGDPLLRVTYKFSDIDRNIVKYAHQQSKEILEKMGADYINVPEIDDSVEFGKNSLSDHTGGGVIMGDDPATSAVNTYSQMWDMENLFVVGASSFPLHSSSNPTGTVGALAYRAAEGMKEYMKNNKVLEKAD
ncbi:GMC family oxidoreductase [Jeotgalicoccus halotolerans]|uniref:Gluconate 2-dehydrogenase alpha chain n=1 Tax=Jeotgalicoccus halotolerans TaxID=157227 RepID=A0A3E0B0P7_9STAP|nr:GMC family oxidoreductase [Jeotgalicoccus halotolerans]REG25528.1 gluconate 2-dehydrogenase alpha chain [Jeotgalicoccus halotolerans]